METPVVGEEAVRRVATMFATKRPEDSDVNALFAALKLYHELKGWSGVEEVEVAIVAGHKDEGVKADVQISRELDAILSTRKFDAAVLVSDGPTDELVLPIVQSRIPVMSVQRVVVQQSRGVEESFLLFVRYARRLFEEERYKKYALGLPGAFITLYAVLSVALPMYLWPLLVTAVGLAMIVKGFSIDAYIARIYRSSPIRLSALVASLLIVALALASGFASVASLGGAGGLELLGYFLLTSLSEQVLVVDLLFVAALLPLAAQAVEAALGNGQFGAREAAIMVLLIAMRQVMLEYARLLVGVGSVLTLMLWVTVTILALTATALLSSLLSSSFARARA